MGRVRVDGSTIATEIAMPGLPRAPAGRPDWTLRVERGDPEGPWPPEFHETGGIRGRGGVWARFAEAGTRRGVRLRSWFALTADPRARTATLRHERAKEEDRLVLRRALPYLSALDGRLVLHAACVAFPAGAVVLCADARTGKSTLALALDAAGVPVLGDDHVVVARGEDGRFEAHASVPWVEVAPRSVRALRSDVAPSRREGPVALRSERPARLPIVAIAFLRRGSAWRRRRVAGLRRLPSLLRRYAFVGDPADPRETASRFDAAAALLASVPSVAVTVPDGLRRLHDSLTTPFAWWGEKAPGG